jgi:hypothetical protein
MEAEVMAVGLLLNQSASQEDAYNKSLSVTGP